MAAFNPRPPRKISPLYSPHLRGFGPHTLSCGVISFSNMSGKPILSTINTINKLGLQDGPVHPPEPAHTNPPSDRDPHCLSPESTGIIPSSSPNLHYSSMQQHGSHTLRRNESDLGPSGGESPPESSAGGLFRNVSIASYAASIPDTKRSQLSIASNDMASAATTPHKVCCFNSLTLPSLMLMSSRQKELQGSKCPSRRFHRPRSI